MTMTQLGNLAKSLGIPPSVLFDALLGTLNDEAGVDA